MTEWRLKAFRAWLKMAEPTWPNFDYGPIDYQDLHYYSAPKQKNDNPKNLEEVDAELLKTFDRLGIPLTEQKRLTGVAVDAVFDSISVGTTHKSELPRSASFFAPCRRPCRITRNWLRNIWAPLFRRG